MVLSTEHGLTDWLAWATSLRGWAMAGEGRTEEGIAQIRKGLAASRAVGAELLRPYHLCLLAEACMETGRLDDGLSAVTEALAAADEHEIRFYNAETHRLKGELLLRQNDSNAAEAQSCMGARSSLRAVKARNRGSCARRRASLGCSRNRVAAMRRARCSPKSTAGSPKVLIPPTSRTPRRCSRS
jgi:predicted ATPase